MKHLNKPGRKHKYHFDKMSIGDSMLAEGRSTAAGQCPAYAAATVYGRCHNMKFSGQKEGEGQVRITRIS